ncbi:MAG: ferredoxin-thioredoxin reductase variable chain [Desertifilum sp.]|nr:ferredoxin-thioredoxin reductase variable chain [Desertifilum sp.]
MKMGDRVRIAQSVIVYHHPEHRSQPFDLKGLEGEVISVIRELRGKPISANLPIYVRFSPKFSAHLRESEVELIS